MVQHRPHVLSLKFDKTNLVTSCTCQNCTARFELLVWHQMMRLMYQQTSSTQVVPR
jgi:hypothetical protein